MYVILCSLDNEGDSLIQSMHFLYLDLKKEKKLKLH